MLTFLPWDFYLWFSTSSFTDYRNKSEALPNTDNNLWLILGDLSNLSNPHEKISARKLDIINLIGLSR